ncbi:Heparin sulfate O-sulfotransferase [Aphelenchoides besseyi]|nr:Heparin sulfate O-sulfotransferase [Aphelenchoides besseyi]
MIRRLRLLTALFILFLCVFAFYIFNHKIQEKIQLVTKKFEQEPHDLTNDLIVYNRIPKTGSTTFTNALAYDLCRSNGFHVLHINTTKNNFLINAVDQATFVRNITQWTSVRPAFYHGHIAFVNFQKFGYPNPIYINITFDHCFERGGKDCDPADKMWLQIPYFCGTESYCKKPGNIDALNAAKRHLVDHYLVVGYTERLKDMIIVLERLLPNFFKGAVAHYEKLERVSEGRKAHLRSTTKKIDLKPETLELLKANSIYKLEREFYEFAVQEFDSLIERLHSDATSTVINMNVQLLNFLKEVPLKNWFNYFVDPKAFKAEVINAKGELKVWLMSFSFADASLAGQLLDQFIENALGAVNDVRSSKTKKKDPDDILFAEEKKRQTLELCVGLCGPNGMELGSDVETLQRNQSLLDDCASF